jgi:hypothetical protein
VPCYWRTSVGKWNEMEGLIHWRGSLDDGLSETLHSDCGGSDSISKVWLTTAIFHCEATVATNVPSVFENVLK